MKKAFVLALSLGLVAAFSAPAFAHCQIPCGIYGDNMRFQMLLENLTTIEKSMNEINALSGNTGSNINQLVRWVANKEEHADAISEIVTEYFLKQRVKPVDAGDKTAYAAYQEKLTVLHGILVYSMKAKQTTDLDNVEQMRKLVHKFAELYLDEDALKHLKEHHQ